MQAQKYYKQNEDLPPSTVSKREKKPFVKPIQHGSHQKRMKRRELRQLPPKPLKAPANGMLVERLIPVAHSVYEAYLVVLDGVSRLLKHLPVKACRCTPFANRIGLFLPFIKSLSPQDVYLETFNVHCSVEPYEDKLFMIPMLWYLETDGWYLMFRWCSEVHVGRVGHEIKTCQGKNTTARFGEHLWVPGYLDDVVMPLEAFHLVDRVQKPIKHEDRFNHDRVPAIVELCIQAGLDLPEFPTLRRTTPIDSAVSWPKFDDGATANDDRRTEGNITGSIDTGDGETKALASSGEEEQSMATDETGESSIEDGIDDRESQRVSKADVLTISDDDDLKTVAEKTLRAWDKMRAGAANLMNTYPVRACGYCPEVHIGRRGHKLQLCGAFKHQWRNGQHGWQDAALDDLIPQRFLLLTSFSPHHYVKIYMFFLSSFE